MGGNIVRQIITTYVVLVALLALGFFGVGALAKAVELRDPMQPPTYAGFFICASMDYPPVQITVAVATTPSPAVSLISQV